MATETDLDEAFSADEYVGHEKLDQQFESGPSLSQGATTLTKEAISL